MLPFFSSHYSIGKSLLRLTNNNSKGKPDGILELAKRAKLQEVFLVEDSMIGFLEAQNLFKSEGIPLRFGIRMNFCNDVTEEDNESSSYKIIIFAKNDNGCKQLYRIFSKANIDHNSFLDEKILKEFDLTDILIVHPFYDSYLFHNQFFYKNCIYNPIGCTEFYSIEKNNLPFDHILSDLISSQIDEKKIINTQTIYYEKEEDAEALQIYRLSCNRSIGGKQKSLSNPDLRYFGSRDFSFQSYLKNVS